MTAQDGAQKQIDELLLLDVALPAQSPAWADARVTLQKGDIADAATVRALIDRDDISVFHLASVVSGGGEKDFDLALSVNLTGGLNVFEACRARAKTGPNKPGPTKKGPKKTGPTKTGARKGGWEG